MRQEAALSDVVKLLPVTQAGSSRTALATSPQLCVV